MTENIKMKKEKPGLSKAAKIVLIAVTAVAALLVIGGLNKVHPSPFSSGVQSIYKVCEATGENSGVIIDQQGKRLLFTDADGRIVNIVDPTKSGSPINRAIGAVIEDETVRVHGGHQIQEGIYYSSESIVDYTSDGKLIGEEYRQDYGEDERITRLQLDFEGDSRFDSQVVANDFKRTVTVDYSTWFMIKNIIYWLGALWLAVAALWFVIYLIAKKLRGKAIAVTIGILCILFTAAFYTLKSYQQIRAGFEDEVSVTTQQLSAGLSETYGDKFKELSEAISQEGIGYIQQPEVQERIADLQKSMSNICNINGTLNSYGINIIIRDDSDRVYMLADSRGIVPSGTELILTDEEKAEFADHDSTEVIYASGVIEDVLMDFGYIYDSEGNRSAVVEVLAYEDNILSTQSQQGTDVFITLLAIFIGLYMVVNLCMVFAADLKRWGSKPKTDLSRSADMSGIYMFIYKVASSMDDVITVYVAASLCVGMDPAKEAVMVAIPLTALSIGRWVGTFLATPLIKKLGERLTGILSCIVGLGSVAIIVFSIETSNIYIYSIGKALWGLGLSGTLFVVSDLLPLNARSDEQRVAAMNSSQQGVSAAAIITALISGYISEYVGYSIVYIVAGAMTVILLVLTCMTFGKKGTNGQGADVTEGVTAGEPSSKGSLKDYWTIFLRPEMLIYIIFYIVPVILTGGYSIYLFPLYSAGAGLSVVLLSNISVFSKTLTYVANEPIKNYLQKFSSLKVMVIPEMLICAGMICFFISPNIYWAIIMLFAVDLLSRLAMVSSKMYRVKVAEHYGLDDKLVTSNYYTIQSALYVFQSPVLSAFVTLGTNSACAAVGGVCGVLLLIFGGYARKKAG